MAQTNRINWRQAASEALLIFFGVAVALGGQAWWEARNEKRVLAEHTENLIGELRDNQEGLTRIIEVIATSRDRAAEMLASYEIEDPAERLGVFEAAFPEIFTYDDFQPASAALETLLSSGALSLYESVDVRLEVSRYSQLLDRYDVIEGERAEAGTVVLRPLIIERFPVLAIEMIQSAIPGVGDGGFEANFEGLMGSVAVQNAIVLSWTAAWSSVDVAGRLLEQTETLISSLEATLE